METNSYLSGSPRTRPHWHSDYDYAHRRHTSQMAHRLMYAPAEDSHLLASCIPSYVLHKTVLDMGTGSGILARTALESGASKVVAVDSNLDARKKLPKQIQFIHSDLYRKVKGTYDIILCNPPYLPDDAQEDVASKQATTGGKKGDEFILRFLKQSVSFLNKEGHIILLLSSLTPQKRIKQLLFKHKLTTSTIARKNLFFERLEVWEIQRKPFKGKKVRA